MGDFTWQKLSLQPELPRTWDIEKIISLLRGRYVLKGNSGKSFPASDKGWGGHAFQGLLKEDYTLFFGGSLSHPYLAQR